MVRTPDNDVMEDESIDMKNFDGLGLHSVLQKSLKHMNYTTPTPIQAQAIPVALEGRDILGSAQTGTGKTAAFAIPLVQALLSDERKTALVMTPTRELGKQVMDIMQKLIGPKSNIKTAFLIGGDSMGKQNAHLKRRPRLIVGTPGRINDHLERGNLNLDQVGFLVLDETDRMLDMGFSIQIDRIVKHMPDDRQTLLFSATLPKNITAMADKYQKNPERIAIGSTVNVAENIDQKIVRVNQDKKFDVLTEELDVRGGSIIVFVKTKRNADRLAKKLRGLDYKADAIHGDLKQSKRSRVIQSYRSKNFRILVATDVVARGLDVPHVEHVINYDMPQMPEDYIHRIGRTARAGAKGEALCLVSPQDGRKWHAIEQMMFPDKHGSAPANDERPRKNNKKRKKPHRGQGNGPRRDERKGNREERSDRPYKGKKDFRDRDNRDNNEGKPHKKKNFKKGKPSENKSNDRDFSEGRQDGAKGKKGQSYKAKRSFSENKKADGRSSNEGRKFSKDRSDRSEGGEDKFVGKQTKRSRNFKEGGKPTGGQNKNGGKRKFAGKPVRQNDGDQPPRVKRSGGKKTFAGKPKNKGNRAA
ncbi:MAG: DEAD/DEAH box helicase [Alcanivorax sp.]